jgi:predicted signal transduction protein with EAL and GGDEF domain
MKQDRIFFERADTALYRAKENGRNLIVTLPFSEDKSANKGHTSYI